MSYPSCIKNAADLVTSREETRAGFIRFALEKNRRASPFIESAKHFRNIASVAKNPIDLLDIPDIQKPLLTAAGLSDKALGYLNNTDRIKAIKGLIDNFLIPAGKSFVDEAVFRYLLIKGDSLGGSMRNLVGALAQQKLTRAILSVFTLNGIKYKWLDSRNGRIWLDQPGDDYEIEIYLKGLSWESGQGNRTLVFNLNIPAVKKNVDICMFDCSHSHYSKEIINDSSKIIMLGELKGGIDPAGADEHWKTANSALNRIRTAFIDYEVKTSFIGAAIESDMAIEIYDQLMKGMLDYVANLTKDDQMTGYCSWLLTI